MSTRQSSSSSSAAPQRSNRRGVVEQTPPQRSSRNRPQTEGGAVNATSNGSAVVEHVGDNEHEVVDKKFDWQQCRAKDDKTGKDLEKFQALLSVEAQAQCINKVSRLFFFKGTRKETVSRAHIIDVLGKIDTAYKKHVNAVLNKVQLNLSQTMGYAIVPLNCIVGNKRSGKKDEYFVTNNLDSVKFMRALSQSASSEDRAYYGFMCVVFFSVYVAKNKQINGRDLLIAVRKVDHRFPANLDREGKVRDSSTLVSVPELGDDFLGLIKRMVKEHYLVQLKREADDAGSDPNTAVYVLGPRFHLDIGRKALMTSYFALQGQPVDQAVIKEIEDDERKERIQTEEQDEEGEDAEPQQATATAAAGGAAKATQPAGKDKSSKSAAPAATSSSSGSGKKRRQEEEEEEMGEEEEEEPVQKKRSAASAAPKTSAAAASSSSGSGKTKAAPATAAPVVPKKESKRGK